jgi:catechol-2,3-dioxygenase
VEFLDVTLEARPRSLADLASDLASFYLDALHMRIEPAAAGGLAVRVGRARLTFSKAAVASIEPFYHFALLVPGDRFEAALEWLRHKTTLLPDRGTGGDVFHFDNWKARACYCLDPAGNIVEFISHHGVAEAELEEHSLPPSSRDSRSDWSAVTRRTSPTRSGDGSGYGFGMETSAIPIASRSRASERAR